jgi:hypothetical protein
MTCANCPHVLRVNATVTGCAIPRITERPCFDADVAAESRREDRERDRPDTLDRMEEAR